jgi:hypothetical protein
MKQYLLAVHTDFDAPPPDPEVMQQRFKAVDEFNAEIISSGNWVFGGGLHPPSTATVVRAENSEVITTDGPFAETKEHLGGFWIVAADDLDAALAIATRASAACGGPVEVRPFQEDVDGAPQTS